MNKLIGKILVGVAMAGMPALTQARQWTLQDCIDYALQNNISIRKTRLQQQSSHEDVLQ